MNIFKAIFLFLLIIAFTGTSSAAITINDADYVADTSLSSVAVPSTSQTLYSGIFIHSEDSQITEGLYDVNIPSTSQIPYSGIFIHNEDSLRTEDLHDVNIPSTSQTPYSGIFIHSEDSQITEGLYDVNIPSTSQIPYSGIFIHSEDSLRTEDLHDVNIPSTSQTPYSSIFIHSEDSLITKGLHDVSIPSTSQTPYSGIFIHNEDFLSSEKLIQLGSSRTYIPPSLKLTTSLSDIYSLGEPIILTTTVQNTDTIPATFNLVVTTNHGYSTTRTLTLPVGSTSTEKFNIETSGIGSYTATIKAYDGIVPLASSSQTFMVIDPASLQLVEDEAESLKTTAISEFDKMAEMPASATSNLIINYGFDILKDSIKNHLGKPADSVKGADESGDLDDLSVGKMVNDTEDTIIDDMEAKIEGSVSVSIIRQINQNIDPDIPETINVFHLKESVTGLIFEQIKNMFGDILTGVIKDYVVKPAFTQAEEDKVILRDNQFDAYAEGTVFSLDSDSRTKVLQRFNEGRCAISSVTDSKALFTIGPYEIPLVGTFSYSLTLTEEYNKFNELDELKEFIGTVAAALAIIGVIFALIISILGSGGAALVPLVSALPHIISWLNTITSVIIPVTMSLVTVGMFVTVPIIAPEVTYQHDATLDTIEDIIASQSLEVSVSELSTSSAYINDPTSTTITVDNMEPFSINPITESMVISPDGRVIDIQRQDPYVLSTSSTDVTYDFSIPQKPGTYQVLGMVHSGSVATSAAMQEMEVSVPAISITLETEENVYNSGDTITISANFTNNEASDISDLIYVLEVVNTSSNTADMLTLGASSSHTEELTFTTTTEGTYIAKATLLLGLSEIATDSVGFTVGSGEGLMLTASPSDLYAPESNVTVPLFIENIGTIHTDSIINISTYDELAGFTRIYTDQVPVSLDASASDTLNINVLPYAEPGIYRTILKAGNFSAESFEYTVTADGTIFTLLETDKPYYNLTETVYLNTTVNDVLFNATGAAVNLSVSEPAGNISYLSVAGDTGQYSAMYNPVINGTYDISATSSKTGFRSYSDETFVIVGQRSTLTANLPYGSLPYNDTSLLELQVTNEFEKPIDGAIVSLTGCGVNSTELSDQHGNVSFRITLETVGPVLFKVEKGGYAAYTATIDVIDFESEKPIISITSPANGTIFTSSPINISGTAADNREIASVTVNDVVATGTTDWNATIPLSEGENNITAVVTDNAGNQNSTSIIVYLETTVPGDFNNNGRVDIGDVSKVAFMVAGKVPEDLAADFNNNGRVDIGDAAKIAFYLAGKVSEL